MYKFMPVILVLFLAVSCAAVTQNAKERGTLAGVLAGEYTVYPVDSDDRSKVGEAKRSFKNTTLPSNIIFLPAKIIPW